MPKPTSESLVTSRPPKATFLRIQPATRQKIERLALDGVPDNQIAKLCCVTPKTARKYSAACRPKPDYHVFLDEHDLSTLKAMVKNVVKLPCPKCHVLMMGLRFLPATRCTRCGGKIEIPLALGADRL